MESVNTFIARLQEILLTADFAWQLSIAVVAAIIGWLVNRRWQVYIIQHLGADERRGLKRMALRGSGRIVFPIVALLVVLAAAGVLSQLALSTRLLDLLAPLLFSFAVIRILVYLLRRAFGPSAALRAWEGAISTIIWAAVALHLLGWLPEVLSALDGPALTLGDKRISILSLLKFAMAAGVFIILARWLSRIIETRTKRSAHLSASMQVGLSKISKVVLYTIAILVALDSVGIDLTTLTVFGGALGVGIGFGLQRIASNFISGFILLFDRSVKPGDVITIGNRFGWVVALHARYIVVCDRDGVETLIPNENLITSEVINWSFTSKKVRIKLPVQISYADDPEKAMQIMVDACKVSDRVIEDPAPRARLLEFGDSGINMELRLWIRDPENGVGGVKSDVNLAIWKGFKENGITIPFPQRDIHMVST